MAIETPCQTPEAVFHTHVGYRYLEVWVELPFPLALDEQQAAVLDSNLHNAVELVLAPYFSRESRDFDSTTQQAGRLVGTSTIQDTST